MAGPGIRNLITDVAGLKIGQAEDEAARTGVTVLLGDEPFMAVADIRGGAPGTRDVEALEPVSLVESIDAICLSGGSAFGLDAPGGVQSWLNAQGRGFQIAPGAPLVPVVSGAILFDLANGGDKDWGEMPPYRALGAEAAAEAGDRFRARQCRAPASAPSPEPTRAASAAPPGSPRTASRSARWWRSMRVGSPVMPGTRCFLGLALRTGRGIRRPPAEARHRAGDAGELPQDMKGAVRPGENTTIAIVATDAVLSKVELKRLTIMAADGFARALRPVHTPFDGDLLFGVATAKKDIGAARPRDVMRLGHVAADCLARAIARGVYAAETLGAIAKLSRNFP